MVMKPHQRKKPLNRLIKEKRAGIKIYKMVPKLRKIKKKGA